MGARCLTRRFNPVEEGQHPLGEQRRGGGIVRREREVGEEVFLPGVEEQLGLVGGADERLRRVCASCWAAITPKEKPA